MAPTINSLTATLEDVVPQLIHDTVVSAERVSGGRNSQLYKIACGSGRRVSAKHYFQHENDSRDRLGVEFAGLKFLWDNAIRSIPEPLAADRENQWAVYEWIEGDGIAQNQISGPDIDEAADFLAKLRDLTGAESSEQQPSASEACFSVEQILANLQFRLNKLDSRPDNGSEAAGLSSFLVEELKPFLQEAESWCRDKYAGLDRSVTAELPVAERTLSPSDFGFHNALKRETGQLVFVDFEYFGWDDPAKTVSDFLLHPAMDLNPNLKRHFSNGIYEKFDNCGDLSERVSALYPLFGLKWCLIILNEFLPEHLLRRDFAGVDRQNQTASQAAQLTKAKGMLARIRDEYEQFPYHS